MPGKYDKTPIQNPSLDRRVKLTNEQKAEILGFKGEISQRELARRYNVSKRTIQFILFPEKLEENLKRRKERGGWLQYYDKEKHRVSMQDHREYKKKIFGDGAGQ